MTAIFWRDVRKFFSGTFLLLIVGLLFFTLADRQSTGDSFEQFLLRILSEHYYITYFMTPVFLLSLYRNLEDPLPFLLIRSKTFPRYFFTTSSAIFMNTALFVILQLTVICLVAIGLPSQNAYPYENNAQNELFFEFANYIETPLLAAICCALVMIAGLSVIGITMQTIHHFLGKRVVVLAMIIPYLLMALGLKISFLHSLPLVTMNRYIILHHNFQSSSAWVWTLFGMLGSMAAVIFLIRYFWNYKVEIKSLWQPKGLFFYYTRTLWTTKNMVILLSVLVIILVWKEMTSLNVTIPDLFLSFFYGQQYGQFHMMSFLEQLLYNGTPLYLLAVFTESMGRQAHLTVLVRSKRKVNWLIAQLGNGLLFLTFYALITVLLIILVGLVSGQNWGGLTYPLVNSHSDYWISKLVLLKSAELFFHYLAFLLLYLWTKSTTTSFLLVLSTHSLILLPFESVLFFPTGLGTVARLDILEGTTGMSIVQAATILGISVLFLFLIISSSYRRFFN